MINFYKNYAPIVLLIICFHTLSFGQDSYDQEIYGRAQLWEKEIAAFVDSDKREFPKKKKLLFVGSSTIRGWHSLEKDFPDFLTINRGFGGSHLEDINFYAPQIVFPYKPKLIVIYAGENDVVAGKSIERVFDDFKKFVNLTHKNLPKTRMIVVSLKPSPARWEFAPKFKELNKLIEAETKKNKRLLFVDLWSAMLDLNNQPKKEIYQIDRLHINAEGYGIWRETLSPHIRRGVKGNFR